MFFICTEYINRLGNNIRVTLEQGETSRFNCFWRGISQDVVNSHAFRPDAICIIGMYVKTIVNPRLSIVTDSYQRNLIYLYYKSI